MTENAGKGGMKCQPFWTPLRKTVFAAFFFIIGAAPFAKGVTGLYEASQHRLTVRQARQSRIAALRDQRSRVEQTASQLRQSVLAPLPFVQAEGRGPSDLDRQRYWSLEGDKAFIGVEILSEETAMKRAEKAAGAVPLFTGFVVLGLAVWTFWFIILYRVIPKSKMTLVFVPTENVGKQS